MTRCRRRHLCQSDMEWNEQRRADDQAAREESDRRAMCQRFGLF